MALIKVIFEVVLIWLKEAWWTRIWAKRNGVKDTAEARAPSAKTKAGNVVIFGKYEQDNDLFNGKEPIAWRVLTVKYGKALLLADKIVDCQQYNTEQKDVTWETCTLRSWLNNEFYGEAFDAGEKAKIRTTRVVNKNRPAFRTNGGNYTDDKVFLLSYSEALNPAYGFSSDYASDLARFAQGTDFSKSLGHWWLRTPGLIQSSACYVNNDGDVSNNFNYATMTLGVRPALWVNL